MIVNANVNEKTKKDNLIGKKRKDKSPLIQ